MNRLRQEGPQWYSKMILMGLFYIVHIVNAHAAAPQVCDRDSCVTVEVVSKQADMEKGLMFRSSLDKDAGMLFVFNADDKQAFWMKNMHFSLDMLWLDSGQKIVYIGPNTPACTSDPCPVYMPDQVARYVLEVNSGYTSSHGWKVGDKLDIKNFVKS